MLITLLKKIGQQATLVLVVLLLLFAAYLSIGRQFFPAISRYKSQLEAQLYQAVGVPIAIDALGGYFEGFSPAISIDGLRIVLPNEETAADDAGVEPEPDSVLQLSHATVIIDVLASLAQRELVIGNFLIDGLDMQAMQDESGNWQLRGVTMAAGPGMSLEDVFDAMKRVARLELGNLSITLQTAQGVTSRLHNGLAVVQNRGNSHFFHLNFNVGELAEQVAFSLEVQGNALEDIDGMLHLSIPAGDYSRALAGLGGGAVTLKQFDGGGQLWIDLQRGQVQRITGQMQAARLALDTSGDNRAGEVSLQDLGGRVVLTRLGRESDWELRFADVSLTWQDNPWLLGDALLRWEQQQALTVQAQNLDLGILAGAALASALLDPQAEELLVDLAPRGRLQDLALSYPLNDLDSTPMTLTSGLTALALESVENSPAMTGINGYLQLEYAPRERLASGFAEVDAAGFTINIPSVFQDTWQYNHVNGRLDFQVDMNDGVRVSMVSNVINAQSDIANGSVQFASAANRYPDGRRDGELTLIIGAWDADGSRADQYLPSTPGQEESLLSAMSWLDQALLDARVSEAGIIFRGSSVREDPPQKKTFQAYFDFTGGQLQYAEQWPQLSDVSGRVQIVDDHTDIRVQSGFSAGLALGPTVAHVRPQREGASLLTINGSAGGDTDTALAFLMSAPLELNLDQVMSSWEAVGSVQADLELRIPLDGSERGTWIGVDAQLEDNRLSMPELALQFDDLDGRVVFDSDHGLQGSALKAEFFGRPARILLSSPATREGTNLTRVEVTGDVTASDLVRWPRHTALVRDVLGRSDGEFQYSAAVEFGSVPTLEDDTGASPGRLEIVSDLRGLTINLPQSLGKSAEQALPMRLNLGIGGSRQELSLALGPEINARMSLAEGVITDGVIYIGTLPGTANPWASRSDRPGLEIRGNLDRFDVREWLSLLEGYASSASEAEALSNLIALIELDIGTLDLFGQELDSIAVEVQHPLQTDYWSVSLDAESVSGSVLVPFDRNDYIDAYIAYLRLPGDAGLVSASPVVVTQTPDLFVGPPEPRVDALASLDPRRFPRLRFLTGDFSIGDTDYGLGQFTLDPTVNGAEFSNLIINFRGLQLGLEEPGDARFSWHYDGASHHSYLQGLITADNLADVLAANGFAPSLESSEARFDSRLDWPGTPAFFAAEGLSGEVNLLVNDGRFLQGSGGSGALKLISILNFDALMRRLRFSDDLLRRGLAYDEITGYLTLEDGIVTIRDRVVISGPSSVYQIGGQIDLARQTINGDMYLTLPVSDNIPWLGLLTANIPLAIGAYLFDRIFGDQVDTLTSAQYTLQGPWEGLQPQFRQAFGTPEGQTPDVGVPPAAALN
ncbi:MAG: hypothetical protein RLZZ385_1719 [Pseudomonadota bacterium]|jgi:uncharacterized protein (TIGR02099 family)